MNPSRLEILLYTFGVVLLVAGAVIRIGHFASANVGFALLLLGFGLGSIGRLMAFRRTRQLQRRNQELEARLAGSTQGR